MRQYVRKKVQDVASRKIHLNLEDAVSLPLQAMFVSFVCSGSNSRILFALEDLYQDEALRATTIII